MTEIETHRVIIRFEGAYKWLSNFYRSPIVDAAGTTWDTVEHYYQAMKCVNPGDASAIRLAVRPGVAKQIGRKIQIRPDWEQVKDGVMYGALQAKFAPGTELASWLLATDGTELVEGNTWHDQYWGSCFCAQHETVTGLNRLGELLVYVRDNLRTLE